jgi:hypothetical protein
MEKTITEIMEEAKKLNISIKKLLNDAKYEYADDLSSVIFDYKDAEQLFFVDEMRNILGKLNNVSHAINYLDRHIRAEGILRKNDRDRYEMELSGFPHIYEFTSGTSIEYLAIDDLHCRYDSETKEYINVPYWCVSKILHNGTDYYIEGADDLQLEGLKVRIREDF